MGGKRRRSGDNSTLSPSPLLNVENGRDPAAIVAAVVTNGDNPRSGMNAGRSNSQRNNNWRRSRYSEPDPKEDDPLKGHNVLTKFFLLEPRNLVLATHLAFVESPKSSPLQFLRLLEQFGFKFQQYLYSLNAHQLKNYPDHNYRVVLTGSFGGMIWRGVAESSSILLANEVAAHQLFSDINMTFTLGVEPAYVAIPGSLHIHPGNVELLAVHCREHLLPPPSYEHSEDFEACKSEKHVCTVRVKHHDIIETSYAPELAKYRAAEAMYKKLTKDIPDCVKLTLIFVYGKKCLNEGEDGDTRYNIIQERSLFLDRVPYPNKPLKLRKQFEDAFNRHVVPPGIVPNNAEQSIPDPVLDKADASSSSEVLPQSKENILPRSLSLESFYTTTEEVRNDIDEDEASSGVLSNKKSTSENSSHNPDLGDSGSSNPAAGEVEAKETDVSSLVKKQDLSSSAVPIGNRISVFCDICLKLILIFMIIYAGLHFAKYGF